MVNQIVSLFYQNNERLNFDSDITTITTTIQKELENIQNLEVWKLHKDKLTKNISIETLISHDYKTNSSKKIYYITSLLYYKGIAYFETSDPKNPWNDIKTINEKFPKELQEYVLSVSEI